MTREQLIELMETYTPVIQEMLAGQEWAKHIDEIPQTDIRFKKSKIADSASGIKKEEQGRQTH